MASKVKWFTCTPLQYRADHAFFARDSGLLCKGFQEIGIECRAVLPGSPMEGDQSEDLIRTDYRNLEDPEWWRSLDGQGVVFYGWGSGKYLGIVTAIKKAGLNLVSHMDTSGVVGILNGVREFSGWAWRVSLGDHESRLTGIALFVGRMAYGLTLELVVRDYGRARHLKQADLIGAISPVALERLRKVCRFYGGDRLADRVRLVPHPNASYMAWDPKVPKEHLVVAVGRWDDSRVKGTELLLATTRQLTDADAAVRVEIYGKTTAEMERWHGSLSPGVRARVRLLGVVPNTAVRSGIQRARVSLCTSLHEGYHTVSAEALCCGCSVVGPDVPEIPSLKWFTSGDYGRLSERNPAALSRALLEELKDWEDGKRNPEAISRDWASLLHAPRVAERILALVGPANADPGQSEILTRHPARQ